MIPSLSELRPLLLNPTLTEADCLKAIGDLSAGFTVSRDKMGKYGNEADLVSAYTMLYLPTNMPKLDFVFSQLTQDVRDQLQGAHFIDFGCGPGTFSLAWLNQVETKSVTLIDYTRGMREQAQKIISHYHPEVKLNATSELAARPDGKVVLFFGHAINELEDGIAQRLINRLDPDFVFFIEPGTSDFFKRAKKLRSDLIESGMSVVYPCPSIHECPNDWCHQVWRGTHDAEVERLCQLAKLDRRTQAMTAHLYTKAKVRDERAIFVRFLNETKFSFEWEVCLADGQLKKFQWMKKQLSKSKLKQMQKDSVGLKFEYLLDKKIDENHWRVIQSKSN